MYKPQKPPAWKIRGKIDSIFNIFVVYFFFDYLYDEIILNQSFLRVNNNWYSIENVNEIRIYL